MTSIELLAAFDGQQALDLLVSLDAPPEVIFLDINMPLMDGHEFLSEYSKNSSNSSVVVMLTSSDQTVDIEKCMKYAVVLDYINKPLQVEHLVTLDAKLNEN